MNDAIPGPPLPADRHLLKKIEQLSDEVERLKKTRDHLSAQNNLLDNLFEHAPMGVTVWDARGRLLHANQEFSRLTGYSIADMRTLDDWFSRAYPDAAYRQTVRAAWDASTARPAAVRTFAVTCNAGQVKTMEFRASFLSDGRALVTLTDVTDRHRTKAALQKQTERYRALSNAAFEAMFVSVEGRCIDTNQAAEKMFGYPREELIGIFGTDVIAPESKARVRENMLSGYEKPYEAVAQRKDGTRFHVEIRGQMIEHRGRRVRIAVVHDINRRKRVETELKASESLLKSIFLSAPVGIGMVVNRVITKANHRLCEMIGFPEEELLNQGTRMLYPSDEDFEYVGREKYRQIKKRGTGTVETRWQRKDGRVMDVLLSSTPLNPDVWAQGVTFTALDITERKLAERRLNDSEERFRTLVEECPLGISLIGKDGRYQYINPQFTEMFGYAIDDVPTGRQWFEKAFPDPSCRRKALSTWIHDQNQFASGEARPRTYSVTAKDGSLREILFRPVTLNNRNQFVIYEDITERTRLEKKLQQAEKMEAIGTLAGGVAHDFNNILMGIIGRTSLMMAETDVPPAYGEHLSGIEEYVKSASDLTRQLLGFARGGKYQLKTIDMNQLVEQSARMFGRTRKEINLHVDADDPLNRVEADPRQVEQVLLNLYVNAWQAMPGGGDLYLKTENVNLAEKDVQPYNVKPGRFIRVSITDTGIGMAEDTVHKIFEPFFTTKERGRGTGLGLASAYGIVSNHGGFIAVTSQVGRGTTFNLHFPATTKPIVEVKAPPVPKAAGTETILLVDDEEMVRNVGGQMLRKLGYTVFTVPSGEAAVAMVAQKEPVFDLVILDMIMPGMNGGEAYDRLKQLDAGLKVLLSSGYSIDGQAADILSRGCNGFIQKPFGMNTLSAAAREILDAPDD
ncbi:histidine kinase [Desulfosarcina alkanivorans]|uniref:histidine kinase n=1 Tax=Desulfosarcina alkanivorans TaxID=571177 RepID=A0A5K7YNP0_9BACT|nr:PAS domain-containing sensor histidine kinase [Desulfosarcina alkanivorans]BBO70013.1 histidine kinase [Desulfosarcina alkanivorans]